MVKKPKPFVSLCTPTFNRRPFLHTMIKCFLHQTYPKDRMEWIIVDDGTDCIRDDIESFNIPQIKYYRLENKLTLGEKRNLVHSYCKGDILVYMDDDDYYPPERVSHAVEKLQKSTALCAGSSILYIYFKPLQRMVQFGPYGPNHATAGTFAFKRSLLDITRYEPHAELGEERFFLKNYTIPFVQLDPLKTILVFSHEHNTFDKRKLLLNPNPAVTKDITLTVDDIINDETIKQFFMIDIDNALDTYEPGKPHMKPGALEQIRKTEQERSFTIQFGDRQLSGDQIVEQLNQQHIFIQSLKKRIQEQKIEIDDLKDKLSKSILIGE